MNNSEIKVDLGIENGNPCLVGTRLTVFEIVYACDNDGVLDFLDEYTELTLQDINVAFRYCVNRRCDEDGGHCGGCSLRTTQDGFVSIEDYVRQYGEIRFTDSRDVIQSSGSGIRVVQGTKTDFEKNWRGLNGWEIAARLIKQY